MKVPLQHGRSAVPPALEWAGVGNAERFRRHRSGGFTLLETLIVVVMIAPVVVAGIGAIILMDRSSRAQAQDTTAMEIAQGELEDWQATTYNPPVSPFTSTTYTRSNYVTLALNKAGTATSTSASVVSKAQPIVNGHLVTVTVSFTNYNRVVSVQMQSVVNALSAGQP